MPTTVPLTVQEEGGSTHCGVYLPQRRVRAWAKFGNDPRARSRQVVLDTGAPFTTLRKETWVTLHAGKHIEWVCYPPDETPREMLPRTTLLGGCYPFRLGRIRVELVDLGKANCSLPPKEIFALCTEDEKVDASDPDPLPALILLGMAGVLNGRTLTLSASADGNTWSAAIAE